MIEISYTLLFILLVLNVVFIIAFFISVRELRFNHKYLTKQLNEKVSEFSFELERDQRRDIEKRVELLYNHFGLIIRTQPSQKIESLKD